MNPRRRQDQLLVEELPGELLVYDLVRNKAHCLNQTAAFIWQHCDGATTIPQIAARLPEELGLPADEALVWLALDRLGHAGLLQHQPTPPAEHRLLGRRDLIRKLGLAGSLAVLVPLISTAVIPAAAAAASNPCTPPGCKCKDKKGKIDGKATKACCLSAKSRSDCTTCCGDNFDGIGATNCVNDCPPNKP